MTNIKVAIKFRPQLSTEAGKALQWIVDGRRIKSTNGKYNLPFGKC